MVFPTEILPVVSLVVALINHVFILAMLLVILWASGISPSIYNFQFLYYLFALTIFGLGFSWFLSAINVFFRDVAQIVSVALNMWFWLTPIVWHADMLPPGVREIVVLNPMYYVVEGYRASFVYHTGFWLNQRMGIYFWVIALSLFVIGGLVFRRLKPEFAEVL